VDEDEIVAAFRQQYDDPEVALPAPPAERRTRPWGLFWMVAAAVACAGAYKFLQEDLPAWPQRGVASVPVSQAGVMPASPAPVAPQMPQSGSASRPATDAVQPVRVAFTPQEPVWISVRCDGTESFRGILEGPATREFGAAKKMMILIGNAGGLTASWNGHPIGPIGARGEVQLLEVTAQGARVVPRKSAPPTAPDDGHGAS
jgi:hypothetical protein